MPLYDPDARAAAHTAARTHFGIDPIGHQITGRCPACLSAHTGVCLDAYPPCLDDAELAFDLVVQLDDGQRRLLVGDLATLLLGDPVSVRRVEPTPVVKVNAGDRVFYAHRYDPDHSPMAYDPDSAGWGTVVRVRRRGITICVSLRNEYGDWRHLRESDPAALILRVVEVTAP